MLSLKALWSVIINTENLSNCCGVDLVSSLTVYLTQICFEGLYFQQSCLRLENRLFTALANRQLSLCTFKISSFGISFTPHINQFQLLALQLPLIKFLNRVSLAEIYSSKRLASSKITMLHLMHLEKGMCRSFKTFVCIETRKSLPSKVLSACIDYYLEFFDGD